MDDAKTDTVMQGLMFMFVALFSLGFLLHLVGLIELQYSAVFALASVVLLFVVIIIGSTHGGLGWDYVPEDVRSRQVRYE